MWVYSPKRKGGQCFAAKWSILNKYLQREFSSSFYINCLRKHDSARSRGGSLNTIVHSLHRAFQARKGGKIGNIIWFLLKNNFTTQARVIVTIFYLQIDSSQLFRQTKIYVSSLVTGGCPQLLGNWGLNFKIFTVFVILGVPRYKLRRISKTTELKVLTVILMSNKRLKVVVDSEGKGNLLDDRTSWQMLPQVVEEFSGGSRTVGEFQLL